MSSQGAVSDEGVPLIDVTDIGGGKNAVIVVDIVNGGSRFEFLAHRCINARYRGWDESGATLSHVLDIIVMGI